MDACEDAASRVQMHQVQADLSPLCFWALQKPAVPADDLKTIGTLRLMLYIIS